MPPISPMNTDSDALTSSIIGAAFRVHNLLGGGFLESVYVKSLAIELAEAGLGCDLDLPLRVLYKSHCVGEFKADMLVKASVIVEVKAVAAIVSAHEAQLLNYLRASGFRRGLLINFGSSVTVRRRVL